jgi:hypothetical protein
MIYAELLEVLKNMTPDQLADTVQTYSGDIDDTIKVITTSENSDEEMGESIPNFSTTQVFLVLE